MLILDALIPVPEAVSRRAWECAFELAAERPPAAWHWVQSVAARGPAHITWNECGALFRAHRLFRPART